MTTVTTTLIVQGVATVAVEVEELGEGSQAELLASRQGALTTGVRATCLQRRCPPATKPRPTTGSVSWISMSSPHSAQTTRTVVRCPQDL